MMNERIQIALKLLSSHIALPIGLMVVSLSITKDAYLLPLITQTVLCILFLSGYWEFFGGKFKTLFFSFSESVLLAILAFRIMAPTSPHLNWVLIFILAGIQAYLVFVLAKIIRTIFHRDKENLDIVFPLKNGKYLITDGGNSKISRLMNYHFYSQMHRKNKTNNSMLYATDVVKTGTDKTGFLPTRNDDYPIFGEKVYCPMKGSVIKVENNIDDNAPFAGHYPYNTGNTVVIQNGKYYFLLGHLKKGSIRVSNGDTVEPNDFIGLIGNSGYSERPHIHMQLIKSDSDNYWFGKGICIQYNGKNLYKNRIVTVD